MSGNPSTAVSSKEKKFPVWLIVAILCMALILCACLVMVSLWVVQATGFDIGHLLNDGGAPQAAAQNPAGAATSTFTFVPIDFLTRTPRPTGEAQNSTAVPEFFTITPAVEYELTPFRPAVGFRAPDFSIENLTGGEVSLAQHRGHYVVMDYWATWCPPCREEIPFIQEIHEDLHDEGLVVLGINSIEGDDRGSVNDFVTDIGVTFTVLLDYDNEVMNAYNILYLPTSIFIDTNGIIRDIVIGGISESEFRQKVNQLMSGTY